MAARVRRDEPPMAFGRRAFEPEPRHVPEELWTLARDLEAGGRKVDPGMAEESYERMDPGFESKWKLSDKRL
jgi:hypothetical protein